MPSPVNAGQSFTDEGAFLAALPSEQVVVLDFDNLAGCSSFPSIGCPLTTQYPGIEFSNASVWDWSSFALCGGNVTPPNNLINTDGSTGSPIEFAFDNPVSAVGLYNASPGACATDSVQLTLYDPEWA